MGLMSFRTRTPVAPLWRRLVGVLLAALSPLAASPALAHATCAHHDALPVAAAASTGATHAHHGTSAATPSPENEDGREHDAPCTCTTACCPAAALATGATPATALRTTPTAFEAAPCPAALPCPTARADRRLPPSTAPPAAPVRTHC